MTSLPMLASPSTPSSNRRPISYDELAATGEWAADLKLDGIRAFAQWDGSTLVLTNRNGVDISKRYPEITSAAGALGAPIWLDGEIVAHDGKFETVATRDKQSGSTAIKRGVETSPCIFFAFDLPGLADMPWTDRRWMLEQEFSSWDCPTFQITVCQQNTQGKESFLASTAQAGLEGVIAKRRSSRYEFGARSKSWVKFKNLHRVSCLVSGYTTGTGSRAHFGAMHLALVDESGEVVPCGRVGTGFTAAEITDLKDRLDRSEILVVEIEALNRTSGGTLRFPVYKGIRSDVAPADCTTAQLDALPYC